MGVLGGRFFLKVNPRLRFALVVWPVLVVGMSALYQKFKPPKIVTSTDLSTLLEVLRRVVGAKVERFTQALAAFREKPLRARAKQVFTTITQPDHQLDSIVSGIYQFFEAMRPQDIPMPELRIRVALAKMGETHIERFEFFFPPNEKPRSKIKELQRDECGFSRAKAAKRIVIVEDIVRESTAGPDRAFVVTDDGRRTETGSMVCYPVLVRGSDEVPYVISICTAKARYFKESEAEYYRKILEHFEQRIVLEYCLKSLKGIVK